MKRRKSLGIAFTDQVGKVTISSGHFKKGGEKSWKDNLIPNYDPETQEFNKSAWRAIFFIGISLVIFFLVFLRLFHLTIVQGSENRELADGNRIQVRLIHAPRGVIYDRNGKILAQNNPGFRLIDPKTKKASYITRDQALQMEADNDPRFKDLEIDSIRIYPMGEKTAHILGYVGEITEDELKNPSYKNYRPGDKIGRGGVEEEYESLLKGADGGEVIEVDAQGKKIRTLRQTDPIPGKNLYLTIDSDLQNVAFNKLKDGVTKASSCCGAVVIENPNNGEILSLASYPSFDPNHLETALTAPNSPILNRAISGTYPPGSTFKIASALAGLSSGEITPQTEYIDNGFIELGPYKFTNWYYTEYGRTEGPVNMVKALQRSNDIYFYEVGQKIGETKLGDYAKKLGLGKRVGVDIPGESNGLIPTDAWKEANYNQVWYPGDTLHMAIGQGFVLATPLQINHLVSFVASNGYQYTPHLALRSTDPDGSKPKDFKFQNDKSKDFSDENIQIVKSGLDLVPKNGGTAWPFFPFPVETAGKTGTAEFGDPQDKTHAWYTSFAPANNPKLAMTVLVEAGGEGSNTSAPISKEIYRWYFSPDKNNLIKDVYTEASSSAKTLGE